MKSAIIVLAAAAGSAYAQQSAYGQCGGTSWTGKTSCVAGYVCASQNPYYYQCVVGTATSAKSSPAATKPSNSATKPGVTTTTLVTKVTSASPTLTKVSSISRTSSTSKISSVSKISSSSKAISSSKTTSPVASSTKVTSTAAPTTVKATPVSTKAVSSTAAAASTGALKYAGVNIAGFDFGCGTDGTCTQGSATPPGAACNSQMQHFVTNDKLNAFRLPVAWQYLVNWELGGTIDETNFAAYNELVQNCTAIASMCIVDVHNYARWDGDIINQSSGAVTNADFTSLWSQLATKFASQSKTAFGIMNEPHDITDMTTWGATVQAAVTAIRQAGATSQIILLPGNAYTTANGYVTNSGPYLQGITNIDGSFDNLIFDVHAYLDSDNSGTASTCVTNNTVDAFGPLATYLRSFDPPRQAMLSETGGGSSDSSCEEYLCQELQFLADNSDVFIGYTGWAAGSFATSYVLSETPSGSAGSYTDQPLVSQCIVGVWQGTYKGGL